MSYGYKTVLELDGKMIDVTVCSYSFEKGINEDGDMISPTIGGTVYLSLADIPQNNILEWGIKHRKYKTGRIKVLSQDGETAIPEEEIVFENAACINLKLSYECDHNDYFTTFLTISAESICVGQSGCWINKDWNL